MTNKGNLMSIDRFGINRGDIGPLARSSFEVTEPQFTNGSTFGETDNCRGVSAKIMLGQLIEGGTGNFGLILDEDMLRNNDYKPDDDEIDDSDEEDDKISEINGQDNECDNIDFNLDFSLNNEQSSKFKLEATKVEVI